MDFIPNYYVEMLKHLGKELGNEEEYINGLIIKYTDENSDPTIYGAGDYIRKVIEGEEDESVTRS